MNLTNEQLDRLIKSVNATYDAVIGVAGDYDRYHAIAENYAELDFGVMDYDAKVVDARVMELGELMDDHDCDADLDAYSRRFDCEV